MAQASIEHSDIARPEHGHFITEKTAEMKNTSTGFSVMAPEINPEAYKK
ncbi:hypothetical protein GRAQ_00116 [Rahnella aquatilis CIP 78.65 = ATCC 33071]|nr:hypothetical protein [Rahnella aquatilis]KFD18565.1 hypothetical protein GRAQ_00116 [Rahnella aquatilis CIP 78.65 = ATCC 33071]